MEPLSPAPDFDAVYSEHAEFVWRSLGRLGVPPSALSNAMQEVFLVAYKKLPAFEGRSSVKT